MEEEVDHHAVCASEDCGKTINLVFEQTYVTHNHRVWHPKCLLNEYQKLCLALQNGGK